MSDRAGRSVSYDDIFGRQHKTEFCEQVVAVSRKGGKGQFVFNLRSEHNCMDKDCKDYQPTDAPSCKERMMPPFRSPILNLLACASRI